MRGIDQLVRELKRRGYGERLCCNEPLAQYTTFGIGGPADLLLVAERLEELQEWVRLAREVRVPVLVLGKGSNVLVADAGVRGLVIINRCQEFELAESGLLLAQGGVLLNELAWWTVKRGWAGLEWAVGIPGTVGGAVVGNAGAYGGCIGDVVRWALVLSPEGREERWSNEQLAFDYRTSALKHFSSKGERWIVLQVALQLTRGEREKLEARARNVLQQRRERTPQGYCAGSVFKRTVQYPAGFLIEQAGLKGYRIGGAEVSRKHANFFMNIGGATANEMRALMEVVSRKVWETFGQRLEPEIEFIGEWEDHLDQKREEE
ncbi:MAG: UDP-N-acetylmuramate dehydrogenase [Anaerolineae bacterium]|nr:UDP-N-acetylmuramate dehydrogenase [Anaerolineae bacterium]